MNWLDYDKYGGGVSGVGQINHYYGDPVRLLFVLASAVWLLALPFFPDLLPFNPLIQVFAVVVIIVFAALTNPSKRWVMAYDALIAGIAVVVIESAAINQFEMSSWLEFAVREVLVVLFLIALYLSLKTVRAMYMNQIGKESEY
ncbi:hypothetical protein JXR01_03725 [Candidatus Kaiserbacteria bacterium]|nr:MAG: hypothetical protein JXR01_03725 [Candidatus Kaiserbacteria bacterium]